MAEEAFAIEEVPGQKEFGKHNHSRMMTYILRTEFEEIMKSRGTLTGEEIQKEWFAFEKMRKCGRCYDLNEWCKCKASKLPFFVCRR